MSERSSDSASHIAGSSERTPGAEPRRIEATLTEIDQLARGEHVFVLSNGETWAELSPGRHRYKPGTKITISPAAFGTYLLTTPEGGGTRVRRLK